MWRRFSVAISATSLPAAWFERWPWRERMVRLDHEGMDALDGVDDLAGGVAEVGKDAEGGLG
jgi:hypothetical protein